MNNLVKFKIGGYQSFSLIDYPGVRSAIIFTQGCNFRCGYCHNPELTCFAQNVPYHLGEILEFLKKRRGKLEGVVITGGEPTLQPDLIPVMSQIKDLGYLVKLDSNGSNPQALRQALDLGIVDYIAMDIKAPIKRYREISHYGGLIDNIEASRKMLLEGRIPYEFRTTVIREQLSWQDFDQIGQEIAGSPYYYLQKFIPTKSLESNFLTKDTYSDDEFSRLQEIMSWYVGECKVR